MIAELERHFDPAPLPSWFYAFEDNQQKAIDDLLFARFPMDSLNSDEPADLLIDWANFVSAEGDFLKLLDSGLERWVSRNWGAFPKASSGRLALAWCRLADVVAFVEGLERSAEALLERFDERAQYLGALSDGPSRDALGHYLFAIARYQKDRRLAAFWWELCDLRGATPFYHGRYAIAGLRGLPAPDSLKGGFRTDVAIGLLKLGRAIERMVRDRIVSNAAAEEFFLSLSWHTVAACPPRSAWRQLLAEAVSDASEPLAKWLRKVLPDLGKAVRNFADSSLGITPFNPEWPRRAQQLEINLAKNPEAFLPQAEDLIAEQRAFAEASGDTGAVEATLCRLSRGIRNHDAIRAVKWAEEATNWNPAEPRTWTHWIKALEILGDVSEALSVGWVALERFPENPHVFTELIHLLMLSGRLPEGEQLALEALERFPGNPYVCALLAAILERLSKYSQAEAVFREVIELFGSEYRWRLDLARVLVLQGKLKDAEAELQRAADAFPDEPRLLTFWGGVLARQGRLRESEDVLKMATRRFQEPATRVSLAGTLRSQGSHRLKEALVIVDEVLKGSPGNVHARAEKARILGDMGEFAQAASIMEELRRRDRRFVGDEPDVLADFMIADFARQQTREMEPPTDRSESPTAVAIDETPADPEAYLDRDEAVPVAKEPPAVRPDKSDSEETASAPDLSTVGNKAASDSREGEIADQGLWKINIPSRLAVKQDQWRLATTISEARLLRKWARRNERTKEPPTPNELRRKASRLLERVLSSIPNHPRACLEKASLLIESGSFQDARRFLEDRISSMPSALGLRQALARVNRELARERGLKFDQEQYGILTAPLVQLQQRNPAFQPLAYLGRGRICFAMHDGRALNNAAAKDFGQLRKYISEPSHGEGQFHAWWSEQIQSLLFSQLDPQIPLTADNVGKVEEELEESGQRIDALEEDFMIRMSQ